MIFRAQQRRTLRVAIIMAIFAAGVLVARDCDEGAYAAASSPDPHDVSVFRFASNPEAEKRIVFTEFSVLAPQGENWIEGPRLPEPPTKDFGIREIMKFSKLLPQDDRHGPHTALATVSVMRTTATTKAAIRKDASAFLGFRMGIVAQSNDVGRMKLVWRQGQLDTSLGYQCFRFDFLSEDRGVPLFKDVPFKMYGHDMECISPSSDFIVALHYSERVPPEEEPVGLFRDCEVFMRSLQFSPTLRG